MFNKKIMLIFSTLIGLITVYVIICLVIFLSQRKLLYHPNENNYLDENKLTHKIEKVFVESDNKLIGWHHLCLLYTSPSPRDSSKSRMPASA